MFIYSSIKNTGIVILCLFTFSYSEVIFAFEHFRHGLSEIFQPEEEKIFKDMYNFKIEGDGDLTPIGMRMHYLLGYKNRLRYHNLLSKIYDPKEIIVYSSQQIKAIMSAQAQLLGMFPPQPGTELTDDELVKAIPPNPLTEEIIKEKADLVNAPLPGNMQVVPVHLLSNKEVSFLQSDPESCYPLQTAKRKLKSSPLVEKSLKNFNATFGLKLQKLFHKFDTQFLFDYQTIYILTNNFLSDYLSNKTNLDNFKKVGIDIDKFYKECYRMQTRLLFNIESNEDMAGLALSPTIKNVIEWMDRRMLNDINGETVVKNYDEPKFVMYSGHAKTLVPFELFMKKIFKTPLRYPNFGSYMFFELHRDKKIRRHRTIDNYYIEYYFDNELLMRIPYSQFKSLIESNIWSNDRILKYCQVPLDKKMLIALVVTMILISLLIFIVVLFLCLKKEKQKRRKKPKKNRPLNYRFNNHNNIVNNNDANQELI